MADAQLITELSLIDNQTSEMKKAETQVKSFGNQTQQAVNKVNQSTAALNKQGAALQVANSAASTLVRRLAALTVGYVGISNVLRQLDRIVAIGNLSQQTGIAVQKLSEMEYAAQQVGTTLEQMTTAGSRLTRDLQSSTSAASVALKSLGVDARDTQGRVRQLDDLLPELADRFAGFANGANKAATATTLFGEELGLKLIPLLNKGSQGIEELRSKARAAGGTIDEVMVRQAREAKAAIDALQTSMVGLIRQLSISFAPALTEGADALAKFIRNLNFNPNAAGLPEVNQRLEETRQRIEALKREAADMGIAGKVTEVVTGEVARQIALLSLEEQHLLLKIKELRQRALSAMAGIDAPVEGADKPTAPGVTPQLVSQVESLTASLRTTEEAEQFSYQRRLEQLASFSAARLTTETQYNELLAREQFRHTVAMEELAQRTAQIRLQAVSGTMQEASNLLGLFAGKSRAVAIAQIAINKGLAIAQAIQNTTVAATRALAELGPIAGPPEAAAIKIWGAAQVALIAATGLGQAAGLGSSTASSGGGTSAGTSATETDETTAAAPSQSIEVIGIDPASFYTGEILIGLLDEINNAVRNGATLISTKNIST